MKLVLATGLTGGTGFGPFFSSLTDTMRTLDRAGIEAHFWASSGAAYIDDMRNEHVAKFLETDATHLVFLDYDMEWDFAAFQRLITADVPVVSGTYRLKSQIMRWTAIPEYDSEGGLVGKPRSDGNGHLVLAAGIPAGFTCYKREVFEAMRDAAPNDFYHVGPPDASTKCHDWFTRLREGHSHFGEDFSFSLRWRRLGGQLWIDPDLTLKHWGLFGWRGNQHEQWLHEKELAERFPSAVPMAAE
jgi:hypothetical protein